MMKKICSGGQTGVDRAALDFARSHNIQITGWCPKGGLTEDFPTSPGLLSLYPELKETSLRVEAQRTELNVRDSDATLIVCPSAALKRSKGTEYTIRVCKAREKPYLVVSGIKDKQKVSKWLSLFSFPLTLNVAGPRESEWADGYKQVYSLLEEVLGRIDNGRKQ